MMKILSVELMKDEHVMFPGAPGPQHKMVSSQGFSFSIENKAGVAFVRIKDPRGHVRHIPVAEAASLKQALVEAYKPKEPIELVAESTPAPAVEEAKPKPVATKQPWLKK
jgi:hypothetical protein